MSIFVSIILDTVEQARLAASFVSFDGAEGTLMAWAATHHVTFDGADMTQDQNGSVARHYQSTDGMVKAVILEMPLVGF